MWNDCLKHEKYLGDRCKACEIKSDEAPKTSQQSEVGSSPWIDALYARSYIYDDLLAAWIAGRAHERKYGNTEADAPDFITWLKERSASIGGDMARLPAQPR